MRLHRFLAPKRNQLGLVLAAALFLRLAHWLVVKGHPFVAHPVNDGAEFHRWALEIAGGNWMGQEAFFQAPLYPYFLASIYALFGPTLNAVYVVQIILAVAGCYALYRSGVLLGGHPLGLTAAGLFATYPVFLFYDVQIAKESLAVTSACFLLWALASARVTPSTARWISVGLVSGLLSLLRENMLLVTPFLLFAIPQWRSRIGARHFALISVGLLLVLLPIALRNGLVGESFLPTASNGGMNFYIGNNADADGRYQPLVPGKQIPLYEHIESKRLAEEAEGRALDAGEVSSYWLRRSLAWAITSPLDFLVLQIRKVGLFWSWYEWPDSVDFYYLQESSVLLRFPGFQFGGICLLALAGLGLTRGRWAAFQGPLVFAVAWMLATVAFFVFSRFRLPMIPALILLAALSLVEAVRRIESRKNFARWAVTLLVLVAWLLPALTGFRPQYDLVYTNLGRVFEEAGETRKAEHYYQKTLEENPRSLNAALAVGTLAAQDGRWDEALSWFEQAVEMEPDSDDAWSNLGGALLALRRDEASGAALDRALRLNPQHVFALQNRILLAMDQGNQRLAQRLARRLRELDPGNPILQQLPRPR